MYFINFLVSVALPTLRQEGYITIIYIPLGKVLLLTYYFRCKCEENIAKIMQITVLYNSAWDLVLL